MIDRSALTTAVINSPAMKNFLLRHHASICSGKIQYKRATIEIEFNPSYHIILMANGYIREAKEVPYDVNLRGSMLRTPPEGWDELTVTVKDYEDMLDYVEEKFSKRDIRKNLHWDSFLKKKKLYKLVVCIVFGSVIEARRTSYSRDEGEKIWWENYQMGKEYIKDRSNDDLLTFFNSGDFSKNYRLKK